MKALCIVGLLSLSTALSFPVLAQADWLMVRDTDLRIEAGSALDFSFLIDAPDALRERIGINSAGRLALNQGKGEQRRFLCAPLVFSGPHGGFPDHAEADELAKQLRLHGYGLARFHFVDATLMKGRDKDFDYNPKQVDRFHYLLAALKKQGIRWMIDAASSWNGVYGNLEHRFVHKHKLRMSVHYDPASQAHWRKMVDTILNVRNPYTGGNILGDPALTTVTLFNEMGINFGSNNKGYPPELKERFREWRRMRGFADEEAPERRDVSERAALMQAFIDETERATAKWMSDYLRKLGYAGFITAYNNGKIIQAAAARGALDVVSMHEYHDIPKGEYARPGSEQKGGSAVADALAYIQHLGISRYLDRPFIIDEYDHTYWNAWRREAIAMPAYAALQDWDAICRYDNPVALAYDKSGPRRNRALGPFTIGLDPVARAGETLAALLYARGDVSRAKQRVPVTVNKEFLHGQASGVNPMPESLSRMVLVTTVGLVEEGKSGSDQGFKADAADAAHKVAWVADAVGKNPQGWRKNLRQLRGAGLLPAENRSDEAGTVYQSDTGEILLEPERYRLTIRTPRTEAFSFGGELPAPGEVLKVEEADVSAMVSLSSLDGRNLPDSRRMLLIVATDALNTGDQFSNNRRRLEKLGQLPALIQPINLRLALRHNAPGELKLYALSLAGKRNEPIAVEVVEGVLHISISTAKLAKGPTTYFELTRL